jgi:hypothetical protein
MQHHAGLIRLAGLVQALRAKALHQPLALTCLPIKIPHIPHASPALPL